MAPHELTAADAPDWLSESQKVRWAQVVRDAPRGILHKVDAQVLAVFVTNIDLLEQASRAQQQLDRGKSLPLLAKGDKGTIVVSPYVKIAMRASIIALRAAAELGFSPVARANMTIDNAGKTAHDDARWRLLDSLGAESRARRAQLMAAKPASAQSQ